MNSNELITSESKEERRNGWRQHFLRNLTSFIRYIPASPDVDTQRKIDEIIAEETERLLDKLETTNFLFDSQENARRRCDEQVSVFKRLKERVWTIVFSTKQGK